MDKLIMALGPAFVGGFAVQRFLEVIDPLLTKLCGNENKKIILGLASLLVGFILVYGAKLSVLRPLGILDAGIFDCIITGFVISVGSEGLNSILKFLGYAKEERKVAAAVGRAAATEAAAAIMEK
ncbi:MAG: hypothetical protein ACM3ZC_07445 [Bacteroidota bacterium]